MRYYLLNFVYSYLDIIKAVKARMKRRAVYVADTGEMKNALKILIETPQCRTPTWEAEV
jgi:hypothetical protein